MIEFLVLEVLQNNYILIQLIFKKINNNHRHFIIKQDVLWWKSVAFEPSGLRCNELGIPDKYH